ncbi:hypothetical protein HYT04_01310 [Candidatus Kaiserbacteria bacterium]|nr:hypothetical protein [Candidatus Kaiserbacteria bacterium]
MKTIIEHIERVKGQPHHVRRRIAFGTAAAGTAIIALTWLAISLSTGAFALKDTSFARSAYGDGATEASGGAEQLAGVGAAALLSDDNAPASIEIIDSPSSSSPGKKAEPTIIPF